MRSTSSALALEVYAEVMDRNPEVRGRMDKPIRGAHWAESGR
jgi:hypothetical protein